MAHEIPRHQLDNPLFHYYDHIDDAARIFAKQIGADVDLCVRAARIACDPPTWTSVDGITPDERKALEQERDRKFFGQPKMLKVTIITLCFSAMVQGWVQSVINGANQTLPEYFGWKRTDGDHHEWVNNGTAIWKFAAVNAITYLSAGVCGCWFADPLQSGFLGRRGAIFASSCLCIMASIGAACVQREHWWHLLIWRMLLGLGLGSKASVTPVYGAEVSPNHLRGTLVMNWQLFDAFGIFCGFSANLIVFWTGELAWRFQIASACIPAIILGALVWTCPESPRWLLKHGRGKEAFIALCTLRETPLQAAMELFFANAQIQREIHYMRRPAKELDVEKPAEKGSSPSRDDRADRRGPSLSIPVEELGQLQTYHNAVKRTNYWTRILQLTFDARTRRSVVAAGVVMLGQQLCGVNVLAFYSTVFIQDINGQSTRNIQALWLSWGLGLANFVFTFPAYWWIDKYGRRFLLLATYPGMILSLLSACLSFLGGGNDESARIVRVCVFIFIFIFFYSLGQGPVAFAYAAEVFPLWNREAGMSAMLCINLTAAGLLTLFVPRAQVSSHTYTTGTPSSADSHDSAWRHRQATLIGVFTGLCTLSFILILFLVPETKLATTREDNKRTLNYISLEELNQIFQVRTWQCVRYYFGHVVVGRWNNALVWAGVRGEERRVVVEESMHFWVRDGLGRGKKEEGGVGGRGTEDEGEGDDGGAVEVQGEKGGEGEEGVEKTAAAAAAGGSGGDGGVADGQEGDKGSEEGRALHVEEARGGYSDADADAAGKVEDGDIVDQDSNDGRGRPLSKAATTFL